jgi:hypothetical protein
MVGENAFVVYQIFFYTYSKGQSQTTTKTAPKWERTKKIFNIIASRVENVTPWLERRMLTSQENGEVMAYPSTW